MFTSELCVSFYVRHFPAQSKQRLNVAAEFLALLYRIQEVTGSDLKPKTLYPEGDFLYPL
jgi:hypothetical protein